MRMQDRTGRCRTAPLPARAAFGALTALLMTVLAWFPAPAQAWATAATTTAATTTAATTTAATATAATATAHRPTVVSLTFDDGTAGQFAAARIMHRYGLAGTFFIITGAVGAPNYMSMADLHRLAGYGDEIGAHTVSHLDLIATTAAETRRQACASRDILTRWGFAVTSFAYPDGAANGQVEAIVDDCGYSTARIAAGLASPGCPGCAVAETVPPADPFAVRTPGQVDSFTTLAELEQSVLRVQRAGGGWLPLVFHHVCPAACGVLSIRDATFAAFVRWLAGERSHGVTVATMHQLLGGPVRPTVAVPAARPHGIVNASVAKAGAAAATNLDMATPDRSGAPLCWMEGDYGHNTARWQRIRDAQTGHLAERLTVSGYGNGGAELLQLFDLGECALPVRPGRSYELSASYRGTVTTQFTVYYRNAAGRWQYWTASPYFSASSQWARADWRTPPVPAGSSGLSFGLSVFANGTLVTGGYHFGPALAQTAQVTWARVALLAALLTIAAALGRWLVRRRRAARLVPPAPGQPVRTGPAGRQAPDRSARSSSSR
jgi:peptidoglycan/xylan/chitin deacetylase (PgdA/CDA1 family)